MISKKTKWLTKIYNSQESKVNREEDVNISWSSSDESDFLDQKRARINNSRYLKCESWINNLHNPLMNVNSRGAKIVHLATQKKSIKATKDSCFFKCESYAKDSSESFNSDSRGARILKLVTESPKSSERISSVSSKDINPEESPVISSCRIEEMSPILTPSNKIDTDDMSPVLGKKMSLKRRKNKQNLLKRKENPSVTKTAENSPYLFQSQESQLIMIDSESPVKKQELESTIESSTFSQSSTYGIEPPLSGSSGKKEARMKAPIESPACSQSTVYKIDSCPSQNSSHVALNSDSNVTSKSSDFLMEYKQPPPRKKKYKKGGLCSQLEKVIRMQKTRIGIWQHELEQGKLDDFENSGLCDEKEIHYFTIQEEWKEFGCNFYECKCLLECPGCNAGLDDTNSSSHMFVLNIGFNVLPKITFKVHSKYTLYPPYAQKIVSYKKLNVNCFFRVSKLCSYKN